MTQDRINETTFAAASFLLAVTAMVVYYAVPAMWPMAWFIGSVAVMSAVHADRSGKTRRTALGASDDLRRLP